MGGVILPLSDLFFIIITSFFLIFTGLRTLNYSNHGCIKHPINYLESDRKRNHKMDKYYNFDK